MGSCQRTTAMSLIPQETRRSYAAQRGVSQGASITLTSVSGGYQALLDCARKCALVLGTRHLDGERLLIPTEELHRSITKLAETFSVALVDTTTDETGTRFVLVWKIQPRANGVVVPADEAATVQPDPNQGSLDLDEY
jgi:hypothetical protein